MHPERATAAQLVVPEDNKPTPVSYAKHPYQIWDMSKQQQILSKSVNTNPSDISVNWQANWDSHHLYLTFAVTDESLEQGDEIILTLDNKLDLKKDKPAKKKVAIIVSTEEEKTKKEDSEKSSTTKKTEQKNENTAESTAKSKEKNIGESNIKKEREAIQTFTFTPFDSLGTQTHLTHTDTGYLLNIAIPWSEIKATDNPIVKANSKLGINIQITDVDQGEKGSQHLYLSDKNQALPEFQLKYRLKN